LNQSRNTKKGFSLRSVSRGLVVFINLGLAFIFLLACLQHWLSPEKFWFIGYLSIAFPYLLLVMICFICFWLFSKRHRSYLLISLIPLAIGYQQIGVIFSIRHHDFAQEKAEGDIRVMTWNIMSFYGFTPGVGEREKNADRIFEVIQKMNPDVICLQEYGQFEDPKLGRSYLAQMSKMGYKYNVLSRDYNRVNYSYSSGLAIFSKHKIINKERVPYRSSSESLLLADIAVGTDTVSLFTTHLQSYRFSAEELAQVEKIKDTEKPGLRQSRNLISKMQRAFRNRGAQVDQALPVIEKSRYPQIVCLDMNDVPTSYAYWKMRGNRKDAFLEKGFGIGRTYMSILPTLRIDYIFSNPSFMVTQMKMANHPYSDHLPVIADLRLQK
jgi:endonuclease/exonuclease/phosphatase family metal-dependent hydrolase